MRLRDFLEIDFILLFAVLTLVGIGILFIYSSGMNADRILISTEYKNQIVWGSLGLAFALVISMLNYRSIYNIAGYLYLGIIVVLVAILAIGQTVWVLPGGIRVVFGIRWVRIGSIGFQVSEFAKIAVIVFLAWYLDNSKRESKSFIRFFIACIIVFLPMMLILIQPDLGTSLVFIPVLFGMTFLAGISLRYIVFLGLTIVFTAVFLLLPLWQAIIMQNAFPALMMLTNLRFITVSSLSFLMIALVSLFGFLRYHKQYFYWICYVVGIFVLSLASSFGARKVLREYQLLRLVVFMNPNVDPRGSGWHIIQSITAIGSGGVYGRGYLQGTQSQYHFLPLQSTDFIFSILSEEWGFRGGIFLFVLFFVIILRLIRIVQVTNDTFGSYIAAGLASMFGFHFFINVGMTMGIMPVTGIPLMFVSYGGSALITAMIGIGLAMSIHVRRNLRGGYAGSLY